MNRGAGRESVALQRRTLIPVPPLLTPLGQPQPAAQAPQDGPVAQIIQVQFPALSDLVQRVIQSQPRSVAPIQNPTPFQWVAPEAIGVQVINTTDVPATVAVAVNVQGGTTGGQPCPVLEFDVGPGEARCPSIDPSAGDPWGPQVQFTVTPLAVPTVGGLDVWVVRRG